MSDMGKRIKQARLRFGVVQEELAEQLGVSRTAIAKWESGRSVPTVWNLVSLAESLGVSTDFLLGLQSGAGPLRHRLSPEAADYLDRFISEVEKSVIKEEEVV